MKSAFVLPLLAGYAMAYAPQPLKAASGTTGSSYPTVNGWTANPNEFCAGLPGALAPVGEFDPLGFAKDLPVQEIKRYREAEVTHGRVAMLATVGYLVQEQFHPLFSSIEGPANSHLGQVIVNGPFAFNLLS